ncbi:MAG TPA: hypothetical protein VEK08_01575 [Planctomycetota bacterium]|nr:hypothetical protein [Planctomycetota bacterium]
MKSIPSTLYPAKRRWLSAFLAAAALVFFNEVYAGEVNNKLVSRAAGETGVVGNAASVAPDITPDGRYMVFESIATNLLPGVSGRQVYLRDLQTGAVELISKNTSGAPGNGSSYQAHVSADARYVSFSSSASDLVAGDTNGFDDIFLRDRQTGTTTKISLTSTGGQTNGPSFQSRITGDGRFVMFESRATNLVPGDTNAMGDGFLVDRTNGTIERVTLTSTGGEIIASPGGRNETTGISDDGNLIVFLTDADASNIVPNDTNNAQDVFLRNRAAATTIRLSVNAQGQEGNDHSLFPSISRDGNTIVFTSYASNLVDGDTNGVSDVFMLNRTTGQLTRITNGNGDCAQVTVSGDGRFVAFASNASNLVSDDDNAFGDQFLYDDTTKTITLLSRSSDGRPGNGSSGSQKLPGRQVFCCDAHVSVDGRFVSYDSQASNLVVDDNNAASDVFLHDRAPTVVARAGADQTVLEGTAVSLDGSGSLGTNLSYSWQQLSGVPIADGTGQNSAVFSFTAPTVSETTVLLMRLVVTNGEGLSSFDTVNVTVTDSGSSNPGPGPTPGPGNGVDSDGDGIPDADELRVGTNPSDPNSRPGGSADFDGDGTPDHLDFDDDGDGRLDADEILAGTNPYDPNSPPRGNTPGEPIDTSKPFTVTKLQMKISFQNKGDSATLQGTFDAPAGFDPAGKAISMSVAGVTNSATLDAKGKSKVIKVTYKKPKKGTSFAGGPIKLATSFKKASFKNGLGLNDATGSQSLNVPVIVKVDGQNYTANVPKTAVSKQGKQSSIK